MAAMAYLQDHFTQPICIEELADLSRMSYRAFTSHFRRYTGSTVVEYLHQKRIAFAKQRLLATGDILASAYDAGFADLAHFYRIFKRMTGQTPRQYMLTQRQHQ
jgi:AraC-like DNA-binding protein